MPPTLSPEDTILTSPLLLIDSLATSLGKSNNVVPQSDLKLQSDCIIRSPKQAISFGLRVFDTSGRTRSTKHNQRRSKTKKLTKKQVARDARDAREMSKQEICLRNITRKVNHQRELALVRITPEYKFFGEIIIQSREDAINTATILSKLVPNRFVLFTDGSAFSLVKGQSGALNPIGFGAAVVYKWYEIGNSWNQRRYLLRGTPNVYRAELSAVAEALAIAFSSAIQKQVLDENSPQ
jgi:hypothetical protein